MTLDLTHLETLLAAATPGPWMLDPSPQDDFFYVQGGDLCGSTLCWTFPNGGSGSFSLEDTKALVALRNAAPALIARIREQEEIIEQAKGVFTEIDNVTDELDKANARIKELENPQIATVVDPDTGFTINGPEWSALPLKARRIIQELSLQNDALKAEQEWQDMALAPKDDLVLLAQAGHVYLGWWEADVGWLQSDTCQSLNPTHWKHLPKPPTE